MQNKARLEFFAFIVALKSWWSQIWKIGINTDLSWYLNSYFSISTDLTSSIKVSMDNFNVVKEFLSEKWLVLLLSPESWWSENRYFDWSVSLFQLMFPIITGSIPPIQTSSESFLLAVTFGPVEFLLGFLASKTWYCKISKKCFRYWFISIFKHMFLPNYRLSLLH